MNDQIEKIKQDRSDFKARLEQREREQIKSESKIKALEKLITNNNSNSNIHFTSNNHNFQRTPLVLNRITHFTTPSTNSDTQGGGSVSSAFDVPPSTRGCVTVSKGPMLMQSQNITEMTPLIGSSTSTGQMVSSSAVTTTNSVSNRRLAISNKNNQNQPPVTNSLPPISTPSSVAYRNKYATPTPMRNIQQIQEKLQLQSSASNHGVPVANRRAMVPHNSNHNRRSKSVETWLDHKSSNTPKLDTVMQPKMERKISVSKLELSDTKKSSKYLLTHQQQDSDGEIITNLIKGNICQSPSGGANCIFTDIEVLSCKVQEPAKPVRKRPSEENVIDDKNVVQDRVSRNLIFCVFLKHRLVNDCFLF